MDYRNNGVNSVTSGGYGGTAMLDAPNGKQRDTISAALDAQNNAIVGLFELLNKLESVLSPVLAPPPPNAANTDAAPPPSGVLDVVRAHNRNLNSIHARIGELIDRVHI